MNNSELIWKVSQPPGEFLEFLRKNFPISSIDTLEKELAILADEKIEGNKALEELHYK